MQNGTSSISMETSLVQSATANQHQLFSHLGQSGASVIAVFPRLSLATKLTVCFDWLIILFASCDWLDLERRFSFQKRTSVFPRQ